MNLPGIIIIGTQKCGTSTLHNSLISHSKIKGPCDPTSGLPIKEIDFFCYDENWSNGLDWYTSHFTGSNGIFVDSSPNYITFPGCYNRIHDLLPEAKIILSIRNPVYRAYSQYNHYKQELPLTTCWDWMPDKSFHENIQTELKRDNDHLATYEGFLGKGIYIHQINELLKHFRRDQVYITILEHWKDNYASELAAIQDFLNLDRESLTLKVDHKREYIAEPLDKTTFQLLSSFYQPYNQQLSEFLNCKLQAWDCNS
jgi:hypothetical protein